MMRKPVRSLRMFLHPSVRCLLLLSVLLVLAGCGSRATQYYVLDMTEPDGKPAVESAQATPEKGMTVSIRQVDIPPYLDSPRMVLRDNGNHLKIAEYHQWGGHLRDNIARIMADNLAARLPDASISMAPFPGSARADLAVLLDIRQFERMPDGYVHLQIQWHVQGREGGLKSRLEHLQSRIRMEEGDYAGMASLMSALLGQLSDRIAEAITGMAVVQQ